MTTTILFFFVLGCCLHLVAPDAQGDALFDLRNSLDAAPDQLSDWNHDDSSPCTWSKVSCDANNNVIYVSMSSMGFTGYLSPRIQVLSKLVILSLKGNRITGGIPEEYGNLSSLMVLNLESNNLTGKIPSSLGNLQNLHSLILSQNNFEGPIPESLSSLPNLTSILLGYNNLSGPIPHRLFQVSKFNFTGNRLNCGLINTHPCTSGSGDSSKKLRTRVIVGVIIGVLVLLLLGSLSFFMWRGRHVAGEVDRRITFGQLKHFEWEELQLATDNFSERNELGKGGFGKVYKGVLRDNTEVAVKRLIDNGSLLGDVTFQREVEMISVAAHRNLLRLIGVCNTPTECLLVYPYMQNLSVAYRLREVKPGEAVLDWATRKRIALGTARGLEYLHEHCSPKIIHRDVKAENVLLTEDFEAVLGDFGFAKFVDEGRTHVTTKAYGTTGHMAPEYCLTGKTSERTDIYGYGVMLLEIVTGQRAVDLSVEDAPALLERVTTAEREKMLVSIVDPKLNENHNMQEVEMIIKVALICTQGSPEDRPGMSDVVRMLEGEGLAERWEKWKEAENTRREECNEMHSRFVRIGREEDSTWTSSLSMIREVSAEG